MDNALSLESTAWLGPLMQLIEPHDYDESSSKQHRMGYRVWIGTDGGVTAMPSLLETPRRCFEAVLLYVTTGGIRKPYRSVRAASEELELGLTNTRADKLRDRIVREGPVTITGPDGLEYLFERRES
jgi:hypothetical protein